MARVLYYERFGILFPCRHFSRNRTYSKHSFTKLGFNDWKHAVGKDGIISCHAAAKSHIDTMQSWVDWKINEHFGTSVDHRLETSRRERINLDKHYLKTVAEVLLLCSRTEISLRGHDESIESNNRGNFLEILDVVANHDTLVKKRMEMGQKNTKYLSGRNTK
ncbi:Zinc finger MYM-type protein 1-like [Oopsacas minuta]|uniref:Zinc finger MYM-type protein 1-like n=1 Tax=Oopsacas minuta TaxID=111878 RepID=A0AAV7JVR6_9METZ|nr:Zinc finger MYM-type protein 1-like [Oopsacas minuta]